MQQNYKLIKENQTIFDFLIENYGNIDSLFTVLAQNVTLSADTVQTGQQIYIDNFIQKKQPDNSISIVLQNKTPNAKEYIIKNGQTIMDVSFQLYGQMDNLFSINSENINKVLKNKAIKYQNEKVGNEIVKKNTTKNNITFNNYSKIAGDYNYSFSNSFFI